MPLINEQEECAWVVERCKTHLSNNEKSAAKAWILTARSLFPTNFAVQYESFSLHLSCGEVKEAATVLADMCSKFSNESRLKQYLSEMTDVVIQQKTQSIEDDSEQNKTIRDLFASLPADTQKLILLQASKETPHTLTKCKVWLATVRLFPDTANTIGLDLYDVLSQQPSGSYTAVADNPFRELLVSDVIPMLAESHDIQIERPINRTNGTTMTLKTSHMCQWLESVACYYTTITAENQLLGRAHPQAGKQGWKKLYQLFMMTAEKCGWREVILSKQIGPHLAANVRWHGLEKISGYTPHVQKFEAPRNVAIACFYISAFLFFEMAWEYCCAMLYPTETATKPSSAASPKPPWILIEEGTPKPLIDEKPSKRRKMEDSHYQAYLNIQTGSRQQDQHIVESFFVAINCWDFLQSNVTYRGEFSRLCQQWGAFEWAWLSSFRSDMALYKGDHNLAMQILRHEWLKVKEEDKCKPMSLRFIVQIVNCSVMIGDVTDSCTYASEVISLVPISGAGKKATTGSTTSILAQQKPTTARRLRLLSCSTEELLPYCIQVIIRTLKDVAFSSVKNEKALGQLLILVQYNWPQEEEIFAGIITTIQKRRKFNFPEFFKYIITVDILEEMLYLYNCESLQISLMPQDNGSKSRAVTRGVNRGARVDLMGAVEKQIKRCDEPIEPLLRTFFTHEKLSLDS